jgi:hypothetical protein
LIGNFICSGCTSLTSLQGAPSSVTGDFYCYECTTLTSLERSPDSVGHDFSCGGCTSLTSLEGAPSSVSGAFDCSKCSSLRKPILSIFKIKSLQYLHIDNKEVQEIVNRHLQTDRDEIACAIDLKKAGYKEYAQL